MAQVTKQGRGLAFKILEPSDIEWQEWDHVKEVCSLICRHSVTFRKLEECLCGDGIHDGEWVNAHFNQLEAKYERLEKRLAALVDSLPLCNGQKITAEIGGDPRGCLVRIFVPKAKGEPLSIAVQ